MGQAAKASLTARADREAATQWMGAGVDFASPCTLWGPLH